MNLRIGLRGIVIVLFLALYLTSLIIINAFFIEKHKQSSEAFQSLKFDESLLSLTFQTRQDSIEARRLLNKFNSSRAASGMIRHEAQIYSSVFLFMLMILSAFIFIFVFYKATKPLKELQSATAKIREGDFSVQLPETGIKEIKELKQSFNSMSRELIDIQKKLVQAEKEMLWKELSRILAHEIKNPLTPIQLSIQRLEEKYEENPEKFKEIFPEAVKIINQEIGNLHNLAHSFSNFAKSIEPEFTQFNPTGLIKEIINSYQHKYNIKLEMENDIVVSFDRTHFYQIITNLVQNAIDASQETEEIQIRVLSRDKAAIIQIIDNGSGISTENISRIFEPYYTNKKKGTGLGLALVKKLVDLNDAEIQVKSKIGQGSTFEITLKTV